MRKLLKTRDLKVGMHVVLDLPWHRHPFLRSSFFLSSENDIRRLLQTGIEEVIVDVALSENVSSAPVALEKPVSLEKVSFSRRPGILTT